jgi:hypothetical protein
MDYKYFPSSSLEKKGMFLEETLEKMQGHSDYLFKKVKRLERLGKPTKELKEKLKDINKGIEEVFTKANNVWKQVKEETK